MSYPKTSDLAKLAEQIALYSQLKHEYGSREVAPLVRRAGVCLRQCLRELRRLPVDKNLARLEPSDLNRIRALRPAGPRRIWAGPDEKQYPDRLQGALLGRFAGCTLGAPVEFWSVERMERWAQEIGQEFPPADYWQRVTEPHELRYRVSRRDRYTRDRMDGVPVDDDLVYTLLGLLIVEDAGPDFTVEDVGAAWLKYLPHACTAEHVALENLKKGIPARRAGAGNNPYCEWIGADIRADPWGYLAPGWPERAADMAWRDAYISHRRQGIYGEMYFAAVIAAAFTVSDPMEALRIGLTEIPEKCALAGAVRWALRVSPKIRDFRRAREAVDRRFRGMHQVHTINNACLTILGIAIGGTDFTRVIGQTVAMGLDNDCTAATAGSIVGAVIGRSNIPAHWTRRFNNTVHSYLIRRKTFRIDKLAGRFVRQARLIA